MRKTYVSECSKGHMMQSQTKFAELVGILLGDGSISIYKRHYRVKVTLNSEDDLEYAHYVNKLFLDVLDTEPIIKFRKGEKTVDLFSREKLYDISLKQV